MPRFLMEVPHGSTKEACDQAIRTFMNSGSHFVAHADWGCTDNEHKAWITLEAETKEQALAVLPPAYQKDAKVIALEKYTLMDLDRVKDQHHE